LPSTTWFSEASTGGTGGSGDIRVETGTLRIAGRSAQGAPATISAETTLIPSGGIGGDAGVIDLRAREIVVGEGGLVSTRSAGAGAANRIEIRADGTLLLDGGEVRSLAGSPTAAAAGGDVALRSGGNLQLVAGAVVNARALGLGDAGDISIEAAEQLDLRDAFVTTEARQALGGNVTLAGGERLTITRSQVTTSVQQGVGTGGNIDLGTRRVAVNASGILARAFEGNGGAIRVLASDAYLESADSIVDASSAFGVNGTIVVVAPDSDLGGELAQLPEAFLDSSQLLRRECATRTQRAGSFVVGGRPLPLPPDGPLGEAASVDAEACEAQ
jgi:hypothetical protein